MNIEKIIGIIKELSEKRKVFVSEDDFKFELAKLLGKNYEVRLEFCPELFPSMHIDILLIDKNTKKWIPIELKYKTKKFDKKVVIDEEIFQLKNQGAKDHGCYLYLKDIERIEKLIEKYNSKIDRGYTIFITNDLSYKNECQLKNGKCYYKEFALTNNITKKGTMSWDKDTPIGTMGNNKKKITLKGIYNINWKDYSEIDDCGNGRFIYLVNEIKK